MKPELAAAWDLVDARLARLQHLHLTGALVPLYESGTNVGATVAELAELQSALAIELPAELLESLSRWNGRWIAHDHVIELAPTSPYLYHAEIERDFQRRASARDKQERESATFERVVGPINPKMNSRRRILFGGHEYSGAALFLDYEDSPEGGVLGQVIRVGEEPIAQFVAPSFMDFLRLVAAAPVHDDDPDHDPLANAHAI